MHEINFLEYILQKLFSKGQIFMDLRNFISSFIAFKIQAVETFIDWFRSRTVSLAFFRQMDLRAVKKHVINFKKDRQPQWFDNWHPIRWRAIQMLEMHQVKVVRI